MLLHRLILYIVLCFGSSIPAQAVIQTIYYGCTPGASHLQASNGQNLRHDAMIEVGAFTVGFDPTAANRSSWKNNWTPLSRANYNTATNYFNGRIDLSSNTAPFTTSNKIWVWVFDRSGNWALYTNAAWTWPNTSPSPFPAGLPLQCYTPGATIVRAGTINGAAEIVCEQVNDGASPAITYTQWATLMLPSGAQAKNQDFDNDGQSNFYEYAMGSNALDRNSRAEDVKVAIYSGQKYLSASISKGWTSGVTYVVELSNNLQSWNQTGVVVVNSFTKLEVRDDSTVGSLSRRFMRISITSND
jgi:hypothetical protein